MGLFGFGKQEEKKKVSLPWIALKEESQLEEAIALSFEQPVLLFKHSTRCSISSMALNRLERDWEDVNIVPYYLDLLAYRSISNQIESRFNVFHQSPQALLIKNGTCVYNASHSAISFLDINEKSN